MSVIHSSMCRPIYDAIKGLVFALLIMWAAYMWVFGVVLQPEEPAPIREYRILTGTKIALVEQVRHAIMSDWELLGQPFVISDSAFEGEETIGQALVKRGD